MIRHLLSFVVPLKDEEHTIRELFTRITAEVAALGRQCEVIFVDDGSTDASWAIIQDLLAAHPEQVVAFRFLRNCGKADALATGFEAACGEIVFTMDADLQDDPKEIGAFLAKLDEGFDIVSGWKASRHDPWHKVLPSRVFNKMLSRVNGVALHDHNCGFKCYRAEVIKHLTLYGEMHRMIPSLGSIKGYRTGEIVVEHHPRLHGASKYGLKRFLRGFMDMQTVYFLKHFRERPLHLFGGLAMLAFLLSAFLSLLGFIPALSWRFCTQITAVAEGLGVASLFFMAIGLVAELIVHGKIEKERRPIIAEALRGTPPRRAGRPNIVVLPPLPGATPSVLVADDSPEHRAFASSLLANAGWEVEEAENGTDAIAKIDPSTAVLLLDLEMPGKSGLDCLAHLRKFRSDVKIIIISGNEEIDPAVVAMKLGAFDYLRKPASSEAILAAVERAMQVHKLSADASYQVA